MLQSFLSFLVRFAYGSKLQPLAYPEQEILSLPATTSLQGQAGGDDYNDYYDDDDDDNNDSDYVNDDCFELAPPLLELAPPTEQGKVRHAPSVWLPDFIADIEHAFISGKTKSGKTVLMRAIMRELQKQGHLIYLISHKAQYRWDCAAVGYGKDYEAIGAAMNHFLAVLKKRSMDFAHDKTDWPEIYIICDEYGSIINEIPDIAATFLKRLGCEGREMKLHLLIFNQSANCDDIGISAVMRGNFTQIYLGNQARKFAPGEFLPSERRPAIMDFEGLHIPLSVEGLLDYHRIPLNPKLFYLDVPGQDMTFTEYYQPSYTSYTSKLNQVAKSSNLVTKLVNKTADNLLSDLLDDLPELDDLPPASTEQSLPLLERAAIGYEMGYTTSRKLGEYLNVSHSKANVLIELLKDQGLVGV